MGDGPTWHQEEKSTRRRQAFVLVPACQLGVDIADIVSLLTYYQIYFIVSKMEETHSSSEFYDTVTVRKFALTEEGIAEKEEVLLKNDNEMAEREKTQLLENAVRHWDLFYKRNIDHFFKDRAWLPKELPEIAAACKESEEKGQGQGPLLIDVGCGVGNALLPLLIANPRLQGTAFDCSPRAVGMLRERWAAASRGHKGGSSKPEDDLTLESNAHESPSVVIIPCPGSNAYTEEVYTQRSTGVGEARQPTVAPRKPAAAAAAAAVAKGKALVYRYPLGQLRTVAAFDITAGAIPEEIAAKGSGDFVLLIFVFSALHPQHHSVTAKRCAELLKPGGMVLFRDYGRFDMAQLRFAEQRKPKVEQNLYARYDGTLAYYFLKEEVEELFCKGAGLEVVESRYCMREMLNRKTQQKMQRIWVQAKFRRPS
ncbi:hypothetical protein Efla_005815 [Eimeria flavescens]